MSPVFRHGRLRLYLLKLLDEAPRHGYEVIRLLQDRFLGVYAPSPGTIYPRLARLEEEGLVTHDEADGRKVYRITEKGREELHARLDDLAELEEEITASVRDIAREVSEDVRETVRSLREELTSAARDMQGRPRQQAGGKGRAGREAWSGQWGGESAGDAGRQSADVWGQAGDTGQEEPAGQTGQGARTAQSGQADQGGQAAQSGQARQGEEGRSRRNRDRGGRGWGDWPSWIGGQDWGDWTGWSGWPGAGGPHGQASHRAYRDLERLARQFARELRMAAWQAQAVSEDALSDLRVILDEALDRIKAEVFADKAAPGKTSDTDAGPAPGTGPAPADEAAPGT